MDRWDWVAGDRRRMMSGGHVRCTPIGGLASGRLVIALLFASFTLAFPVLGWAQTKVSIIGDAPSNGIFDPTVEYAPAASLGWLGYSAVFGGLTPFGPHVETHLASSSDFGATWTFDSVVNPSFAADLDMGGGVLVPGVWNFEVPSLVHDPDDPGAEWKLFSHRVFRKTEDNFTEDQNIPGYSWISYRSAPDPTGPWSPETALFSSGPLPPAPYDSVAVAVSALDASLGDLLVYSEPGAYYDDENDRLYVSLTGLKTTGSDRIILLASDDHGASWFYVGTPLSNSDAPSMGFMSFDGSAIVEDDGKVFLLVTPESPGVLHDGTLAIEFASLTTGALVRDAGVPQVTRHIPAQAGFPLERRGGQADYHEGNSAGGLLHPAIHVEELPEMFQFVSTHMGVAVPPVPALGGIGTGVAVVALAWFRARGQFRS